MITHNIQYSNNTLYIIYVYISFNIFILQIKK